MLSNISPPYRPLYLEFRWLVYIILLHHTPFCLLRCLKSRVEMDPDRTDIHTGLDLFLPGEKSTQGPRYARIEDKVWKSLEKISFYTKITNFDFWHSSMTFYLFYASKTKLIKLENFLYLGSKKVLFDAQHWLRCIKKVKIHRWNLIFLPFHWWFSTFFKHRRQRWENLESFDNYEVKRFILMLNIDFDA